MGYTTDFSGQFNLNKQLSPKMQQFLKLFNETRRMKRNTDEAFGVDGEFFVFGGGDFGQASEPNIINHNQPPSTQPSLWCQWTPTEDGMGIEWDGGEKFYSYTEWLVYLIHKILAPNGYVLNGVVEYSGEETSDVGEIVVVDNRVFVREKYQDGDNGEMTMRTDVVLVLDEAQGELEQASVKLLSK